MRFSLSLVKLVSRLLELLISEMEEVFVNLKEEEGLLLFGECCREISDSNASYIRRGVVERTEP